MNSEEKGNDQILLTKKQKRSSSYSKKTPNSSGSEDFVFSNRSNSSFHIRHCSNFKKFKEYFSEIKNPYYTTDTKFLQNTGILTELNKKESKDKEIKFLIPIENIDKLKIFPVKKERNFFKNSDKQKTGNFIFSNLFKDEEIKEKKLFENIHGFFNDYSNSCDISKFCIDSDLHFKNNNIDKFYKINEKSFYIKSIKAFHYFSSGISHFHSPKSTGKSILFRRIFANFSNYENNPDRYFPLMFFDIKLLNDLIKESDVSGLKKILLHESYQLFREREKAVKFIEKINTNLFNKNIFNMIHEIIKIAIDEITETDKVFILDGYSCEYDPKNILKEIKDDITNNNKFFLQIIYDIRTLRDAEILYENINSEHHINYITNDTNKYYYFAKLKLFSEIKENFDKNEIPKKYSETFGENVSYFFEYKKIQDKITFEDFVKIKHNQIKEEIYHFYKDKKDYILYLNEIDRLIETKEKIYYNEIIKFIPSNYIEIDIEPKPNPEMHGENEDDDVYEKKYSFNYSFPLIKKIIKEIKNPVSFINMKSDEFLNLPGGALGTNFDIEMNKIFRQLMDEPNFFEHKNKIYINIENILEKNATNEKQIYEYNDVISLVDKYYKNVKKKYEKIKFNDYTCIGVFQEEFCGKAFDTLFFTKKEKDKLFNMNLIQIKCSDSYVETNEEELIRQIIYVTNKFSYLLNIRIKNVFLVYLSIYQKPKRFAQSNKDKSFLYNVQTDKFVDFNNTEYKKFPLLPNSIIYFDNYSVIISSIIKILNEKYLKSIILIKSEKNIDEFKGKKPEEIINSLGNNEVYVYVNPPTFNYYYKIDEFFGFSIQTVPINGKKYENIFDIEY